VLVNTAKNQFTNTGFTYDAAGNMTNDGVHSYTYDAEGNIVTVDNGSTATYVYDALNHRVRTVVGSAQTEFVFKGVPGDRSSSLGPARLGVECRSQLPTSQDTLLLGR
jgi:YD repeat-containing protein